MKMSALEWANFIIMVLATISLYIIGGLLPVGILYGTVIILTFVHETGHYLAARYFRVYKGVLIKPLGLLFGIKVKLYARVDEAMLIMASGPLITLVFLLIALRGWYLWIIGFTVMLGAADILMLIVVTKLLLEKKLTFDMPVTRIGKIAEKDKLVKWLFVRKDENLSNSKCRDKPVL